jgi:ankyrin repeat protein
LVKNGAYVDATNKLGDTPLHTSIKKRNETIAAIIIESGANLNISNNKEYTPAYGFAVSLN